MGFCIGGHMTYLTAAETDVAAAASFYGGGIAAPQGPGGQASPIQRATYLEASAKDAWARVKKLFAEELRD